MDLTTLHIPGGSFALYAALAAVALLIVLALVLRSMGRRTPVHEVFGLSGGYELVAADMGGRKGRYIHARGVGGVPDALFISNGLRRIVVGEYKSRRHAGGIWLRERYQVVLYMGILLALHPGWEVVGLLAYPDGIEKVGFSQQEFEGLVRLTPKLRAVHQAWDIQERHRAGRSAAA
jgi:hypothetical protein